MAALVSGAGLEPVALSGNPARVRLVESLTALSASLEHPRCFLLDLPPGPEADRVIDESYVVMEPGDVVIDLTASYWGDTLRRFRRMRHRSIYYVDAALLTEPPAFLVSGDPAGVELAAPILAPLAPNGRLVRAGEAGAAHYVRMVAAALAMTITHARSEVRQLIEAYPNHAAVPALAALLDAPAPPAEPLALWLLDDAIRLHAPVPLLAQGAMLEVATGLDEHRSVEPPPRVGGFVHPDEIL